MWNHPNFTKKAIRIGLRRKPAKRQNPINNFHPFHVQSYAFAEAFCKHDFDIKATFESLGIYHKTKNSLLSGKFRYLNNRFVQTTILEVIAKMAGEDILSFEHKLKKLKKIIDICVPEDAEVFKDIHTMQAVAAIDLANKMQGHVAPVASVQAAVNSDEDFKKAREIMKFYEDKHTKEH